MGHSWKLKCHGRWHKSRRRSLREVPPPPVEPRLESCPACRPLTLFGTRGQAEDAVRRMRAGGKRAEFYYCGLCNGYHVRILED